MSSTKISAGLPMIPPDRFEKWFAEFQKAVGDPSVCSIVDFSAGIHRAVKEMRRITWLAQQEGSLSTKAFKVIDDAIVNYFGDVG